MPTFENLTPYVPAGSSFEEGVQFVSDISQGHISMEILRQIRDQWPGKMVVKGILSAADARRCVELGVEGVVVPITGADSLTPRFPPRKRSLKFEPSSARTWC